MGFLDRLKGMVEMQTASMPAVDNKNAGETLYEFVEFGVLLTLCITHQMWIGVALLIIAIIVMVALGFKK